MKVERNILLLLAFLAIIFPLLASNAYILHIGIMVLFYAVLATSLNLIVGYVGEFSLGHTVFLGLGAYTAALSSMHFGLPLWATVPLAGVVSALFGVLIGTITLRLQGPYFVIITLASAEVLRIIANNWVGLTNGPMGLAGVPQPAILAGASTLFSKRFYFYVVLAIGILTMYLAYRFVYSNDGRAAVTVRENRFVAQSVGIRPFAYAMQAYVLGAFMAGLAGGFYAHYITFVGSNVFSFAFMATMIIMVLIGGKGTLIGPMVGALLITLMSESLREFEGLRLSIFGLIVIALVLFLPNGLMGFLAKRRERPLTTTTEQDCPDARQGVVPHE